MRDAIGSNGNTGQFNVNGGAIFNLEVSGVQSSLPQLSINDTAKFRIIGVTEVRAGAINILENATLEIDGSAGYGMEVFVGSIFRHTGVVRMNLCGQSPSVRGFALDSGDGGDYDSGESDLINVDGGEIQIGLQSKLVLNTHDAFTDLGTFKSRAFKLMKYGTTGIAPTVEFGAVEFIGSLPSSYMMRYDYLGEYIVLLAEGYATSTPNLHR
jgi:hypothetical protein